MTHLRKMMLEELQRRNYAQSTVKAYVRIIQEFANHFHQPPNQLGPQHLRQYQAYLFQEKKLDAGTVQQHVAALRFFYVKTLKRRYLLEDIPRPKRHRKLPEILSPEEVAQLIDSASNLFHRTMLMTLYSTGIRRAELCRLQVTDIDSQRMMVHIRQGKGGHDRDVPLSKKLLETLRVYWRWMKPKNYLFPGTVKNWRADVPLTTKVPWEMGLRPYKELMPMKKSQVDLENSIVHIPDSKTPTGIGDMPMTEPARQAFKAQMGETPGSEYLFPTFKPGAKKPYITTLKKTWSATLRRAGIPYFLSTTSAIVSPRV